MVVKKNVRRRQQGAYIQDTALKRRVSRDWRGVCSIHIPGNMELVRSHPRQRGFRPPSISVFIIQLSSN